MNSEVMLTRLEQTYPRADRPVIAIARTMARLRKMVGKNIGILYFGLDQSRDPARMLYGNIGGPQELDAMSEPF